MDRDKIDYDKEPVYYCKRCLSLRVMHINGAPADDCYCDICGSVNIGKDSIFRWEELKEIRRSRTIRKK